MECLLSNWLIMELAGLDGSVVYMQECYTMFIRVGSMD